MKFFELDHKYSEAKQMSGMTDAELNILLQNILRCDEEMTLLQNVKILKEEQKTKYMGVIETIENAIQSARSGAMINVQLVYEQAMDMQKKMLDQNLQTIKDVAKMKEKQPEFVETIQESSGESLEELEDRYRILEAKMKQLV